MTQGSVPKVLLQFAVPFLIANVLQALYGGADLFVVGQYDDSASVAAVAIGSQVMQTITGIILGITTGTTVLIAIATGAKDNRKVASTIGSSVWLFSIVGVLLTLVMVVFHGQIAELMHTPAEAMADTKSYILVCSTGILFIIGYNVVCGILRGLGDSKTPLYFVGLACVINIVLDFILVGYFHLGATGAALATITAQGGSFVISLWFLHGHGFHFEFTRKDIRLNKNLSKKIMVLGAPIALQDALINISFLIITVIVNQMGVIASASLGVVEKIIVFAMLPPMAIFFPLFTLLEDVGYLPRIAFNLDRHFQKAHTCGKQALTMCMGFGCNAAGVVGCRIIDSPRERLIATLTNNFAPCNGRFPTLIAIISMFFVGVGGGAGRSALSAVFLAGVIVLSVAATLLVSRLLSCTLLKGMPSSFTLELPPYRTPQVGRVLVRSVVDRTLFVLGRAAAVAAPAGLLLWVLANVTVGDASLLAHGAAALDPLARCLGLDGTILIAFILGFPANEIVFPIIIMAYMAQGQLTDMGDLAALHTLLVNNGWTWLTAACTMLFSVMHWPCSTTCLTIRKETGSAKWTLLAMLIPTLTGGVLCAAVAAVGRLFL